jgi:hypothetical protein
MRMPERKFWVWFSINNIQTAADGTIIITGIRNMEAD